MLLCIATTTSAATISYPGVTVKQGVGQSPSLLVMVGGANDESKHRNMHKLATHLSKFPEYASVAILYFAWDQGNEMRQAMSTHKNSYPSSKIVLVGHSWGGDTVLRSGSKHNQSVDLAITMDAVTSVPRIGHLERGSIKRWVNVYASRSPGWVLVGKWGSESRASKNVKVSARHSGTSKMYEAIDTLEILPVLIGSKPTKRPGSGPFPGGAPINDCRNCMLQ